MKRKSPGGPGSGLQMDHGHAEVRGSGPHEAAVLRIYAVMAP